MISIQSEMKNLLSQLEKSQPHAKRSNGENGWKWIADNTYNQPILIELEKREASSGRLEN